MNTEHTDLKIDQFTDHNSCNTSVPSQHQFSCQSQSEEKGSCQSEEKDSCQSEEKDSCQSTSSVNGGRVKKTSATHLNSTNHGSISPSSITSTSTLSRVHVDDLLTLSPEDIKVKWIQQDLYINHLEMLVKELKERQNSMVPVQILEERLKSQSNEFKRRENLLVMKLAAKEHDHFNHFKQLEELKKCVIPGDDHLKRCFVDPAVNFMFEKMRKEVESSKLRVEEMRNELTAWKFTPESNTGKRLMSKCRLLYQENEELGKMISSGRVGQLESNLALQTSLVEDFKKSQSELDEFLLELDENFEGMQSTIIHLQMQLKECKEKHLAETTSNHNDPCVNKM